MRSDTLTPEAPRTTVPLGDAGRIVAALLGPLLALVTFVGHGATASGYGWFRDELYYLACGVRLSFGNVEHPPLIAVITAAARTLTGDSRVGLRLVPAHCAALTVWLAVTMTRRLGGRTFAQVTAGIATALARTGGRPRRRAGRPEGRRA